MENTKEKLILAGLKEIETYGLQNFSTRRVAKACGVSCAAPYKHFKDTQEFIAEILSYINRLYSAEQKKVIEEYKNESYRVQILKVAMLYIRFLTDHPDFRAMIMQNYTDANERYRVLRSQISSETYRLVSLYCREVNMTPEARKRKTFIVRSIIYGAALFFSNGEMVYNEENLRLVENMLDREFDLP